MVGGEGRRGIVFQINYYAILCRSVVVGMI